MRRFNHEILGEIKDRWSPKAFSGKPVAWETVLAVLEAARYAPSCFNEQPWEFFVAIEEEELETVRETLYEKNRLWADKAPVLLVATAGPSFEKSGKNNRWAAFDTGTAWGFLALEAVRRGLVTHAMGGFSQKKLREALELPEDRLILAVIALGHLGQKEEMDPQFIESEYPGTRKDLDHIYRRVGETMKGGRPHENRLDRP